MRQHLLRPALDFTPSCARAPLPSIKTWDINRTNFTTTELTQPSICQTACRVAGRAALPPNVQLKRLVSFAFPSANFVHDLNCLDLSHLQLHQDSLPLPFTKLSILLVRLLGAATNPPPFPLHKCHPNHSTIAANHHLLLHATENTPKTWKELEDDDEPMPDAEQEDEQKPGDDVDDGDATEKEGSAVDEEPEEVEDAPEKSPSPPPVPMVRRKRLGRPPKIKPPGWDDGIEVPRDETPRRRGRGGWRGRGGRKGQPAPITQQAIEKDGPVYDIHNDELDLPEDPEGETKVDKLGYLQGGREYRCRTFTVKGRGDRLYMLSTEPARCVGFRDSYLFFTKHRRLFKSIVDDEEKRDLIERELIPHSYKGRSIGIVTARSVFREFGALIVVGGRRIIDDYDIARSREEGFHEGDLADPNDKYDPSQPYNKNQYVAWFGASQVYHTNAPIAPTQMAEIKKRRVAVTDVNWMLEHAREAA